MIRHGPWWLIGLLAQTMNASAACPYFLMHSKMQRCKVLPPGSIPSSYTQDGEGLLSDSNTKEGAAVQVICACDYTLKGSAALSPQCDLDKTNEPQFILPAFDETNPCSDVRKPCQDLCPKDSE